MSEPLDDENRREAFEERAGILEFDAHLPRAAAELNARLMVYGNRSGLDWERMIPVPLGGRVV